MQVSNAVASVRTAYPTTRSAPASGTANVESELTTSASKAAGSYDFTNMTPKQMQSAMNDLIKSGRMSFDESSSLVGMIPTALSKVNYDSTTPPTYDQPMNFPNTLRAGIAAAKGRGDLDNAAHLQRSLDALTRLQGSVATASSIDLTA